MNYVEPIFSAIGGVVVAGGGGSLITFFILKTFAKGWLDSYFDTRKVRLKNEQDIALAELKSAHDAALKEVQSVIDKDLHRARKRYDREFEVLGEAWTLLFKAFDTAHSTIMSWVVRVDEMDEKTRTRFFEQEQFEHWQIDQIMAFQGQDMVDKVTEIRNRARYKEYTDYRLKFARYLAANGVFMPTGFKAKFEAIDLMVNAALVEFKLRLDYPVNYGLNSEAVMKLAEIGRPLLLELENLIHQRIWTDHA